MMKKWENRNRINFKVVAIGAVVTLLISIMFVVIESWLVLSGNIPNEITIYLSALICLISSLASCSLVRLFYKTIDIIHILMICGTYLVCLIAVNLLVYSEGIHNIVYTILGIGGGGCASLLHIRQPKRIKNYRLKKRIR